MRDIRAMFGACWRSADRLYRGRGFIRRGRLVRLRGLRRGICRGLCGCRLGLCGFS